MIRELLQNWEEINLFTRPRRLGKSPNMSMLKAFFEIGCERSCLMVLKLPGRRRKQRPVLYAGFRIDGRACDKFPFTLNCSNF